MTREARERVPSWQLIGAPVGLADARKGGFSIDPPPLQSTDLVDGVPVLVLDFDGVVSPLPTTEMDKKERGRLVFHAGNSNYVYVVAGYGMGGSYWVSLDLIGAAQALAETFQIVWASSWGSACRPLGTLCGWPPDLPWIELSDGAEPLERATAIRRVVGEDRPVVWCDDQQTSASQDYLSARPGRTLCVRPAKRYGLRFKHVSKILDFAVSGK